MKKGLVECLNCNGKSYNIIKSKNNNSSFIEMCKKCHGTGKIYWLDNLLKEDSKYKLITKFLVRNYSDEKIIINITKPKMIIQKNSFIIYSTPLLERILECKGVDLDGESDFLSKINNNLKLFEYVDYPFDLTYTKFLRRVCINGKEILDEN